MEGRAGQGRAGQGRGAGDSPGCRVRRGVPRRAGRSWDKVVLTARGGDSNASGLGWATSDAMYICLEADPRRLLVCRSGEAPAGESRQPFSGIRSSRGLSLPLRCVLCVRYTGAAAKWAGVSGEAVRMGAGNRWKFLCRPSHEPQAGHTLFFSTSLWVPSLRYEAEGRGEGSLLKSTRREKIGSRVAPLGVA